MSHVIDRLRILIVEDDEDSADLLAETFQDRGHSLEVCREGAQALRAVERFMPHIALLDVGLPDMSGYELAEKVRALGALKVPIRLIALTGYGGAEERARAHEAGFDAHFLKPVHPDVLVHAVEQEHYPKVLAELARTKEAKDLQALAGEK